ncbi:esterase EstB [Clostridium botulinum]|uniref:triacylglycerol lipase n=1 Tax=Clostridium botulinum (strain Langeland / NCTC 10281 / Type F) TaxID=441772 RepID=A7GF16_CLOBL|nr:esterase EstB [Clostridium botulinum]ABS41739.1 triacylglycerol lipase [Clostridium botulinum F str. Langeland]ADF99781.1 triacylglycerol lipase [Clostridium botulinum F str. 230613]KKM42641.1 lipase [Clostridium botulinum]MBY6794081.1 lipase [Clostridium botulinum]MBY6937080.1 lipase [Clostridium botulinum]
MKRSYFKRIMVSIIIICTVFCFTSISTVKAAGNSDAMGVGNNYPIVMVHGCFGWGSNEGAGLYYWGGKESLTQKLNEKGYTVYSPSIGPVSSNWDRACELYTYIVGGTVDYGESHSKKYGHERYGRSYPGVYKQIGTKDSSGNVQKIHLIGHSMGGQTIRLLAQLLENGDPNELSFTTDGSINSLFTGGKSWVSSITSIATPHDGSQEAHIKYGIEPLTHQFVAAIAAIKGKNVDLDDLNYDFQLDQWGLKRKPGESRLAYNNRVIKSAIWKKTKDLSVWDLSPEGAQEFNYYVKAQSDINYFSIACVNTHEDKFTHFQVPNKNMNPILVKSSIFMGRYTNNKNGEVPIDKSWWRNDGVVSVISATNPKVGSSDQIVDYSGTAVKGTWNYLGEFDNTDHIEVCGMKYYRDRIEQMYFNVAEMLSKLPVE